MSKPDKKGPVTALTEQFDALSSECARLRDAHVRALADFDNYRRRVERDLEVSRRAMLEALMLDIVPVMDNFGRAIAAAQSASGVDAVVKGLELIRRQLAEALARHGLCEYSCLGAEFDPRRAEAIGFVESDQHQPNTVVEEECPGYSCGDRVLRPARVVVTRALAKNEKSVTEGDEQKKN